MKALALAAMAPPFGVAAQTDRVGVGLRALADLLRLGLRLHDALFGFHLLALQFVARRRTSASACAAASIAVV